MGEKDAVRHGGGGRAKELLWKIRTALPFQCNRARGPDSALALGYRKEGVLHHGRGAEGSTGVGCHDLLQGIEPGSHALQAELLYHLSHQGNPFLGRVQSFHQIQKEVCEPQRAKNC